MLGGLAPARFTFSQSTHVLVLDSFNIEQSAIQTCYFCRNVRLEFLEAVRHLRAQRLAVAGSRHYAGAATGTVAAKLGTLLNVSGIHSHHRRLTPHRPAKLVLIGSG